MTKGTLTYIGGTTEPPLRTDTVEGDFSELPTEGKRFSIISRSLTEGCSMRFIETSVVREVIEFCAQHITFRTENSTYSLTFDKIDMEQTK